MNNLVRYRKADIRKWLEEHQLFLSTTQAQYVLKKSQAVGEESPIDKREEENKTEITNEEDEKSEFSKTDKISEINQYAEK